MTLVLAHRGASVTCRENTLEAFAEARRLGADGVELDVRRTTDGVLVVHHDAVLPDGRPVAESASADLPAEVPTLAAALEECRGLVVDVEVKNLVVEPGYDAEETVARQAATLLREMVMEATGFVASFSLASIDAAREAEPAIPTGWLTLAAYDQLAALALLAERGHAALQPRHEAVTEDLVAAVHDRGLALHAWTVDDPERIRALAAMGVDAVITNVPDVAVRALA